MLRKSSIDKFIKYYSIDEESESDENDFEDDGVTVIPNQSPTAPHGNGGRGNNYSASNEDYNE